MQAKKDGHILKADYPKSLLHGSLISPIIAATIMNGKYVNAVRKRSKASTILTVFLHFNS